MSEKNYIDSIEVEGEEYEIHDARDSSGSGGNVAIVDLSDIELPFDGWNTVVLTWQDESTEEILLEIMKRIVNQIPVDANGVILLDKIPHIWQVIYKEGTTRGIPIYTLLNLNGFLKVKNTLSNKDSFQITLSNSQSQTSDNWWDISPQCLIKGMFSWENFVNMFAADDLVVCLYDPFGNIRE